MRNTRRSRIWKQKFQKEKDFNRFLRENAKDILESENFKHTKEYIQHGSMTVNNHCLNVAKYSLFISRKLPVCFNEKELVRGALLHDYFLYDWHDKEHVSIFKLHGFYHPGIALTNAEKEYDLTPREKDIIKKHMWPLTIKPPMCREAWVVTTADKWCSLLETFHVHKGHGRK